PCLALRAAGETTGGSAAAAADRVVVHHDAAGAAVLQHAAHAVAAGLDHLAALGVAARAGDDAALVGHVALAHAHRQAAGADHRALHHSDLLLNATQRPCHTRRLHRLR